MTAEMKFLIDRWQEESPDTVAQDIAVGIVYLAARFHSEDDGLPVAAHIPRAAAAWNGSVRHGV